MAGDGFRERYDDRKHPAGAWYPVLAVKHPASHHRFMEPGLGVEIIPVAPDPRRPILTA